MGWNDNPPKGLLARMTNQEAQDYIKQFQLNATEWFLIYDLLLAIKQDSEQMGFLFDANTWDRLEDVLVKVGRHCCVNETNRGLDN